MTSTLAVSEAQQRRVLFEKQLRARYKIRLAAARTALQDSGFTSGALKAEPRAAAESYARLKADLSSTEVLLQTRRESLADTSPEIQALLARAQALQSQVHAAEQADTTPSRAGAELHRQISRVQVPGDAVRPDVARQYELARVDEAREGALIQVGGRRPGAHEHKSRLKRGMMAVHRRGTGLGDLRSRHPGARSHAGVLARPGTGAPVERISCGGASELTLSWCAMALLAERVALRGSTRYTILFAAENRRAFRPGTTPTKRGRGSRRCVAVAETPAASQRGLALALGISLGKTNFLLRALLKQDSSNSPRTSAATTTSWHTPLPADALRRGGQGPHDARLPATQGTRVRPAPGRDRRPAGRGGKDLGVARCAPERNAGSRPRRRHAGAGNP